ncbi:spermidine synthase [Streptomyces sp. NPDC059637]|uniref:spermine/spermidine synthase domain-containing protein n=1 Tax=Streptomyces sp. NPDC059637 TaxID=3347752 RepID=UPI0036BE9615
MIDQLKPAAAQPLPVSPRVGRALVLLCVFVCAACGLVYELELVAVAGYLSGDSVTQTSVVLSVMVFSMGVGSLLAKRWRCRAAAGFAVVEVLLSLAGGLSVMALYASFAWLGHSRAVLVVFCVVIGVLIGAEIPLLMTLIQRIRHQDAGGAVADLFAADYVGALVGGLAFPFLLLPWLGQLTGAMLTGAVNAVAGGALVVGLFRRDLGRRTRRALTGGLVAALAVLGLAAACAEPFERAAQQAVYEPRVLLSRDTGVQQVVVTGGTSRGAAAAGSSREEPGASPGKAGARDTGKEDGKEGAGAVRGPEPLRLFLDGRLRADAADGHRYHEALVHPAMSGPHRNVLVVGGADGLALREVLRHSSVRSVTVVDADRELLRLARTAPGLTALNGRAHEDPRVRHVVADVFTWLRGRGTGTDYDVVVVDLPAPPAADSAKLYSREFFGLARRAMAPGGRLAVHAGSAARQPQAYWTVDATVRSAGLRTVPYRVDAASAGAGPGTAAGTTARAPGSGGRCPADWGLILAARQKPVLAPGPAVPGLRSLTRESLHRAARAVARQRPAVPPRPSTLVRPRYPG